MGVLVGEQLLSRECSSCGETKPQSEWRPSTWDQRPGAGDSCRSCLNSAEKAWRDGREPEHKARDRRARTGREIQRQRRLRAEDPKVYADRMRRWHYGISPEQFDAMVVEQGGLCANPLCGEVLDHVDHDHSCCVGQSGCGECVRGLLCRSCNLTLGNADDSIERLLGLAEYLVMQGGQ